jgi:hypothetical protein
MARRFQYGPLLAFALLAALGVALWQAYPRATPPAPEAPTAVATRDPVPAGPAAPAPPPPEQYPIDEVLVPVEDAGPLPALEDSDAAFLDAMSAALGGPVGEWIVGEFVIPKLVATIHNVPGTRVTKQVYAGRPVAGTLVVAEADGRLWLDAANSARYDVAVGLFERVDLRQAVGVYVRFYPLFQRAWRDLGEPGTSFNDRLIAVIDHVIAAPEAPAALELQRAPDGSGRLRFADPQREGASVGHKAMWRLGPDHAERVRARLKTLRAILAGQRPAA